MCYRYPPWQIYYFFFIFVPTFNADLTMITFAKHIREILLCTGFFWCLGANAQVRTREYNTGAMPSNSIVYALPETRVYAVVTIKEERKTPGELWQYAQRYLGVDTPIDKAQTKFTLETVVIGTYGVPSDSLRYSVEFKRNSSATNVTLTNNNLLLAINSPGTEYNDIPQESVESGIADSRPSTLQSLSPEYIQATSMGRKAKIAAEEIYRLRESRTAIISGESEQPFPDGNAMKIAIDGLDRSERNLTERFTGKMETIIHKRLVVDLDPTVEGRRVAFRFSSEEGLLPVDDLRGEPVYMVVKVTDQAPLLDEKEQKKKERQLRNGVVYNVPGEAMVQITDNRGRVLVSRTLAVAQLGTQEALESDLFTNNKVLTSVVFHQSTGGIKEVKSVEK